MSTGLDPEVFVGASNRNITLAGEVFPYVASESEKKIVHDNAAVEFRAQTTHCLQNLRGTMASRIRQIKEAIGVGRKILPVPAVRLAMSQAEDPSVREFGCDPSFVLDENGEPEEVAPDPEPTSRWRCAGYHIHQSASNKTMENYVRSIKIADIYLGSLDVMMTTIGGNRSEAKKRRQMGYGQAGEFRRRPFGVEYRTLSPWPMRSPMLAYFCHSAMRQIFTRMSTSTKKRILDEVDWKQARFAIMEHRPAEAYDVWHQGLVAANNILRGKSSSSNTLTPQNLRRMDFILRNGGWGLTTWGMSVYTRWIEGVTPPMDDGRRSPGPGVYGGKQERYFPSGSKHLVAQPGTKDAYEAFREGWPHDPMGVVSNLGWS